MPRRTIVTAPDVESLRELPPDEPLIYLNGPMHENDWHRDAIDILGQIAPDVHVASPRAPQFKGALDGHTPWELAASTRAARRGALLFWLPREVRHRCNRSYAAMTRFELGEWAARTLLTSPPIQVIVGIERGFSSGTYLRQRLAISYPNVPVCRTLRQACVAAVELARGPATEEVPLAARFVPRFAP